MLIRLFDAQPRPTFQFRLTASFAMATFVAAASLYAADRAKSTAAWDVTADPPAEAVEWPAKLSVSIPMPQKRDELLFPTSPSIFCLAGLGHSGVEQAELWNLATGKRVAAIKAGPPLGTQRLLSPDGKFLVVNVPLNGKVGDDIEVWSTSTSKRISAFLIDSSHPPIGILDFAGPGEVLTYSSGNYKGKFGHHLLIWDIETGKPLRYFPTDKLLPPAVKYDISPGRNFLAIANIVEIDIFDLRTGKLSGRIEPPRKAVDKNSVTLDSVCFSPDGTEIAALSQGVKGSVITVYDLASGDQKLSHDLSAGQKQGLGYLIDTYSGPRLQFVTEPPGFLWYGSAFVERESGLVVWKYEQGASDFTRWKRILTPSGMIACPKERGGSKLQLIPFPREKLIQSVAAYRGDAPAMVKRGAKVDLAVKIDKVLYGKPEDAKEAIKQLVVARLQNEQLEVGDEAASVMTVKYNEVVADATPEIKKIFPENRVPLTRGQLTIKWTSKDGKSPIYEEVLDIDPYMYEQEEGMILGSDASSVMNVRMRGQLTEQTAQKLVFEILNLRLTAARLPFFVPSDESLLTLPVIAKAPTAASGVMDAAGKPKAEMKKKKAGK